MDGKDEKIKSFKQYEKAGKVLNNAYNDLDEILGSKEELRLSNSYNRDLIEGSVDPLFIIDPEGMIKDINKAVELLTGYSGDELIGNDFSDYFTDPDKAKAGFEEVFREGFVKDYQLEILHKNGDTTSVLYNASIYKDGKGQRLEFLQLQGISANSKQPKKNLKNTWIILK